LRLHRDWALEWWSEESGRVCNVARPPFMAEWSAVWVDGVICSKHGLSGRGQIFVKALEIRRHGAARLCSRPTSCASTSVADPHDHTGSLRTHPLCKLCKFANCKEHKQTTLVRATPTVWQTNLTKIETWQNSHPHAHICARGWWLSSLFPSRWEGEKEIKNREGFRI
jgi:hypothetical protein